jgi:hypothetical protein
MQPVQQHPASVDAYIRYGWSLVPVPPGTKGPTHEGWNKRENALKEGQLPPGWGIGIAHAYSGTMALDIDDWDTALNMLLDDGINLNTLYNAPDAVIIDSGRAGRGKLLYMMPLGIVLESKKVQKAGKVIFELRCGTSTNTTLQDILPPTIHPETKQPYRWAGKGHWMRLPVVPTELLALWQNMLVKNALHTIDSGDGVKVCWDDVKAALACIPADCGRQTWIECGMALHSTQHEQAFEVWSSWSARGGDKYKGEREILGQWESFKPDRAIHIATLFHHAKEHGWERPPQDYSHLFADITATPDELLDLRPRPPKLDVDLLPPVLARRAREVATTRGCDVTVPAWAALSAACACIDSRSRLTLLGDFKVPPILWMMVIGPPGDKKSPGSDPLFGVLEQLELEDRPSHALKMLDYEGREAAWASSHKAYLDYCASPESLLGDGAPTVLDQPVKPAALVLKVTDVTSQKLVRIAAERPRGVACVLDEMASWVAKVTDPKSGDDRSSWVQGYEGRTYRMDRVGDGTLSAENFAVSIYGNIQPEVFLLRAKQLAQDGLLQRFIPAVTTKQTKAHQLGQIIPDFLQNKPQYEAALRLAFSMPPQNYTLSDRAAHDYHNFRVWFYDQKEDYELLELAEGFLTAYSKLEGTCGRLALIMHCVEHPFSTVVSAETMQRAIRITQEYIVPALRYTLCEFAGLDKFDNWVVDWVCVRAVDHDSFTLCDIRASARAQLAGMHQWQQEQKIFAALGRLEDENYIKRLDDGAKVLAHRAEWALNKRIVEQFKEYIVAVVAAKARDRAHQYRHSRKGTPPPRVAAQHLLEE